MLRNNSKPWLVASSGGRVAGRRGTACRLGLADVRRPVAAAVWSQRVLSVASSPMYVNSPST